MVPPICLSSFNNRSLWYRIPTIEGIITVQLTSCLTSLDLTKQVNLLLIQPKHSSWIQTLDFHWEMFLAVGDRQDVTVKPWDKCSGKNLPVNFAWIQLLNFGWMNNSLTCLVNSKQVKPEASHTVIISASICACSWAAQGSSHKHSICSPKVTDKFPAKRIGSI